MTVKGSRGFGCAPFGMRRGRPGRLGIVLNCRGVGGGPQQAVLPAPRHYPTASVRKISRAEDHDKGRT